MFIYPSIVHTLSWTMDSTFGIDNNSRASSSLFIPDGVCSRKIFRLFLPCLRRAWLRINRENNDWKQGSRKYQSVNWRIMETRMTASHPKYPLETMQSKNGFIMAMAIFTIRAATKLMMIAITPNLVSSILVDRLGWKRLGMFPTKN